MTSLFIRSIATSILFCIAATAEAGIPSTSIQGTKAEIDSLLTSSYPRLDKLYKDVHSHPELDFHEVRTSALLAKHMRALGFTVTEKVGGTGVVAIYRKGKGPTVLVRTELDALPILEKTGLPYASSVTAMPWDDGTAPAMHACGHDIHMAMWVGTAETLLSMRSKWSGTLMFIGQPAEESVSGAKAMLADGLFTRFPKPDYGFALHASNLAIGKIMLKVGANTSAVDNINVEFIGKGGHGSMPSLTIDPIVIAGHFIDDVQSVVSRQKDGGGFGVLSIGAIHAGKVGNVIPDTAKLELTLRSQSPAVRKLLLDGVKRTATAVSDMAGASPPVVTVTSSAEEDINDPAFAHRTAEVFEAAFGKDFILIPESAPPVAASEDFSEFVNAGVPSAYFVIGAYDPKLVEAAAHGGPPLPNAHTSYFAPLPEPAIKFAVKAMTLAVLNVLGN